MTIANREIHIFRDLAEMAGFAIKKWREISETAVKNRGQFTVALSGGKTPITFYEQLAGLKAPPPWDKTHIFMADERFVPYESSDSNYRMIGRILADHISIPKNNIHPIPTSESSAKTSAEKYEKELFAYFDPSPDKIPEFDLILLGIGEDGHTASLFPGSPALAEDRRLTAAVSPEDPAKKERITITFPVINNARNVFFLISGVNKAGVINEIINSNDRSLPAANISPAKGKLFFLLDKDAASRLPDTGINKEDCSLI